MNLLIRRLRWGFLWVTWVACAQGYAELKFQGEALVAQGNFAAAHALFQQISTNGLPESEWRWVRFRREDTGWRKRDAANLPPVEEALPDLLQLGSPETPPGHQDRVWAEAQESIGAFHWRRSDDNSWVQTRYLAALGWWAGQTNRALAQARYLDLARRIELPDGWPGGVSQSWRIRLPDDILEKVLTIAEQPADVAAFRLLQAARLWQRGDLASSVRAEQAFERALAVSVGISGREVVLWNYAQWREHQGRLVPLPEGKWRMEPDPAGAIALYRQLLAEFGPGQSRWREPAEQRVLELMSPAVSVVAPGTFLPDSEIVLWVSGRNLNSLVVKARVVDLIRDLKLPPPGRDRADWKDALARTGPVVEELTVTLEPTAPHAWVKQRVVLPKRLPAGAYLLEVAGAGDLNGNSCW